MARADDIKIVRTATIHLDTDGLTDEQVKTAIQKSVDFLLKRRGADGTWEPAAKAVKVGNQVVNIAGGGSPYPGGDTALIVEALLHAGVTLDDPALAPTSKNLAPAIRWLAALPPMYTYVTGLASCALATTPDDPVCRAGMLNCGNYLLKATTQVGGYTYQMQSFRGVANPGDGSNSQYGLLGAWALADGGATLPRSYWVSQETYWTDMQNADGGWPYRIFGKMRPPSTQNMTAAGVASLWTVSEFLQKEASLEPKPNPNLDAGLAAMIQQYRLEPDMYYLYGVCRACLATGQRHLGEVDWYRQGAALLVALQQQDGSFQGDMAMLGDDPGLNTAMATLFLARGRHPVLFSKLKYEGPWNARPHDDENLTKAVAKKLKKPLNWQVLNIDTPVNDPDDWMDAPVILITGHGKVEFTSEQLASLATYVRSGGMIFSSNDGPTSVEFTASMKQAALAICENQYEWRQLPAVHPLFSLAHTRPTLFGISNGVRELWVHSATDLGAAWETRNDGASMPWDIGTSLAAYATGKETLRTRLQSLKVKPPQGEPLFRASVARIKYDGDWNPEPGAWPRFTRVAAKDFATKLETAAVTCGEKLSAVVFPLAHITGAGEINLSDQEVASLHDYIYAGGTLFGDAAGGSEAFAQSFTDLVRKLYPDKAMVPIPLDDPIYNAKAPGTKAITELTLRRYAEVLSKSKVALTGPPKLLGIQQDGRWIIVFSPNDVCSGFLGTTTWGILGYTPESAELLARDIVLTLAQTKK